MSSETKRKIATVVGVLATVGAVYVGVKTIEDNKKAREKSEQDPDQKRKNLIKEVYSPISGEVYQHYYKDQETEEETCRTLASDAKSAASNAKFNRNLMISQNPDRYREISQGITYDERYGSCLCRSSRDEANLKDCSMTWDVYPKYKMKVN